MVKINRFTHFFCLVCETLKNLTNSNFKWNVKMLLWKQLVKNK